MGKSGVVFFFSTRMGFDGLSRWIELNKVALCVFAPSEWDLIIDGLCRWFEYVKVALSGFFPSG